jgi:hypothetical protein
MHLDKLHTLLNSGYEPDLIIEVLRCIYNYQTGIEPITDNKVAEMAFNMGFKCQLDSDNEKWQRTSERRKESGRKGALARAKKIVLAEMAEKAAPPPEPQQTTLELTPEPIAPTVPQTEKINYAQLMTYWNNEIKKNGSNMPQLNVMSERRVQMINARLKKHGKQAIITAINNAVRSDFLNDSTFANFDWIFGSDTNFCKTVDGNYNKKSTNNQKSTSSAGRKMSAMGAMIEDFENGNFTDIVSETNGDPFGVSLPE